MLWQTGGIAFQSIAILVNVVRTVNLTSSYDQRQEEGVVETKLYLHTQPAHLTFSTSIIQIVSLTQSSRTEDQ